MTKYKIYQLKDMRGSEYGFMSWEYARDNGFDIDHYKEVYSGEIDGGHVLDKLFEIFNLHHPKDFKGHSLSVSDVVAIKQPGEKQWIWCYCDSFGWEDVTEYVKHEETPDEILWNLLKKHLGHTVEIAAYGDPDDPASITLEDMDTNEVILDAGLYTICGREDI